MFAVIYQNYVKAGRETEYQRLWHKVANYFVQHRGALGSSLHRTADGLWVAYSRWPDKATRDASWPGENTPSEELPKDLQAAITLLKDCLDPERKIPEICMQLISTVEKNDKTDS